MNSQLVIPDLDPDGDTLTAALCPIAADLYHDQWGRGGVSAPADDLLGPPDSVD